MTLVVKTVFLASKGLSSNECAASDALLRLCEHSTSQKFQSYPSHEATEPDHIIAAVCKSL
jgi:hypothetical protein